MIRYAMWFSAVALMLFGLAGCKVDSINPISPIDGAQPDKALYGVWRYKADGDLSYVHIGPEFSLAGSDSAASGKGTKIIIVDHKRNGITDESYVAHTSRIGNERYLNVVQVEAGKPAGYIFVRYVLLDKNTVRFATVNEEVLKAAIKDGRIKGTTRGEGLASETAITADSAAIENYLRQDGGKLFNRPFLLRRVQSR
ncbi:MAG: hypothetical protein ABI624_08595 [Casimicrobiaceae bacterium]